MAEKLIASDAFGRTAATGWGIADLGGAWTGAGSLTNVNYSSVGAGTGAITIPPAQGGTMSLDGVPVRDSLAEVTYTLTGAPADGGRQVGVALRSVGASNYRLVAWHRPDGATWLLLLKDGSGDPIASVVNATTVWANNSKYHLKCEVVGTTSVTVRAKVWADGATEPASWQLTKTEAATGTLGGAGASGIYYYRSTGGLATAQAVRFDDYTLTDLAAPEPAVPIPMYVGTKQVTAIYVGNGKVNPA